MEIGPCSILTARSISTRCALACAPLSDRMLAHRGASAAYLCTPEANFGAPPRQVFLIQLEAARAEWRRRHPKASPLGGNQAEG
jgi:hypothetical protein